MIRVRWSFDFKDKASVKGIWNNPGDSFNRAYKVDKRGMVRASIEAQHMQSGRVTRLIEVNAEDFVNFQWDAGMQLNTGATKILGLKLVARNKTYKVDNRGILDVSDTNPIMLKRSFRGTGI